MRVCQLSSVRNRIVLGAPLPFSVRAADETLLLARGQVIHDEEQLAELFSRGALVEADELSALYPRAAAPALPPAARAEQLPGLWDNCAGDVKRALQAPPPELASAVHGAAGQLIALINRAPDVALAQVVRHQGSGGHCGYGVAHAMNASTACLAATRYLGWSAADQHRAFKAALTMNLSMLDLQARLATQVSPLTSGQRAAIQEHPARSVEMLQQAGIDDQAWLDAVLQHHEQADGSGYPKGCTEIGELAALLRFADVYTALLSARSTRPAVSAQQAGRELYQMASNSPLCQAVIKSFGIFPPGSCVKLVSGEYGVVARNGQKAYHPHVASLTTADGAPRLSPLMRDSAKAEHAVASLMPEHAMPMRLSPEKLAGLIATA